MERKSKCFARIHQIATVLDPKRRHLRFLSTIEREAIYSEIRGELESITGIHQQDTVSAKPLSKRPRYMAFLDDDDASDEQSFQNTIDEILVYAS